jgi:hypothetical protein
MDRHREQPGPSDERGQRAPGRGEEDARRADAGELVERERAIVELDSPNRDRSQQPARDSRRERR